MFTIATTDIAMNTLYFLLGTKDDIDYQITEQLRYTRTRQFLLIIQAALGDSIWRCYTVYGKSVIAVVLPVLTALASLALGLYLANAGIQAFGSDGVDDHVTGPLFIWDNKSWTWAAITIVCTVYCTIAISARIYLSARLTKSNKLSAVVFFVVETSFIYTLGVILYLLAASGILDSSTNIQNMLMGAIVQLPPIVLCLLLLQIKFYNSGSNAVRYTNPEPARPQDVLRRIFRTGREAPADSQMSTFRVASAPVHTSTHTISMPAETHYPDAVDDMPDEDDHESDAIGQRVKKVSDVLDIA
ncbi:hypothetical protein EVG20_g9903 [Dentipellis fragilis]|uniref:Uncharacterized protein n=1 Tax=Dentipellis fragilis TaxID=205917 RepID=A0A4Y9XW12_9AGAM|nr:hypothetical protein EVG20_g9903 [Dentipellis fragilis]